MATTMDKNPRNRPRRPAIPQGGQSAGRSSGASAKPKGKSDNLLDESIDIPLPSDKPLAKNQGDGGRRSSGKVSPAKQLGDPLALFSHNRKVAAAPRPPAGPSFAAQGAGKGNTVQKRPSSPASPQNSGKKNPISAKGKPPVKAIKPSAGPSGKRPNTAKPATTQTSARPSRSTARRQRNRRRIAFGALITAVVGLALLLSFTVLFPIKEFSVSGESIYDLATLEQAFGYEKGSNIFRFDGAAAEQKMEKQLPYLESIKIRRRLPGTVVFSITPAKEIYFLDLEAKKYILSAKLKVLREADAKPEGAIALFGLAPKEVTLGAPLALADPQTDAQVRKVLEGVMASFPQGVGEVRFEDPQNLRFLYENRIQVVLGSVSDLDYKLALAKKVMAEKLTPQDRGTLRVGYDKQATFNPA